MRTLRKVDTVDFSGHNLHDADAGAWKASKDIRYAWLAGNRFSSMPVIGPNLTLVDLSANQMTTFPLSLLKLQRLERLFLQNNHLDSIPAELSMMPALGQVDLSGNTLLAVGLAQSFYNRLALQRALTASIAAPRGWKILIAIPVDSYLSLMRVGKVAPRNKEQFVDLLGSPPRAMVFIPLTLESWRLEELQDLLYDELNLSEKLYRLVRAPGARARITRLPAFDRQMESNGSESDSAGDDEDEERDVEWCYRGPEKDLCLTLEYNGPAWYPCRCAPATGTQECRLHVDSVAVMTAVAGGATALEQALQRGMNPNLVMADGASLSSLVRDPASRETLAPLLRPVSVSTDPPPAMLLSSVKWESIQSLDDFAVEERLGEKDDGFSGVCSRVYAASLLGHNVALKIQVSQMGGKAGLHNDLLQEQFLREHKILERLNHPNIIGLLHHFYDDASALLGNSVREDAHILVMPLLEQSLLQQIQVRRNIGRQLPFFTNYEIKDYGRQLLHAVRYLQNLQIVHRDLKTDNTLLRSASSDGGASLVICDFGMAIHLPSFTLPFSEKGFGVGGASSYLPPEITDAGPGRDTILDYSKADNWAVGRVLHTMLAPLELKPYDNDAGVKINQVYTDLPAIYDSKVRALVAGLLRTEKTDRFTVGEALTILESIPLEECFMRNGQRFNAI